MGLFDKMTGRARPDDGVEALSAEQVREALVAAPGPQDAWSVAPGSEPGVDLTVEWRVQEPTFREFFATQRERSHLVGLEMSLDEEEHEVRVVERAVTVTEREGAFVLSWEKDTRKGIVHEKTFDKTIGGDSVTTFDDNDVKDPLKQAALGAGWGWHPVTKL